MYPKMHHPYKFDEVGYVKTLKSDVLELVEAAFRQNR